VCELAATAGAADLDTVHTGEPRYLANVHVDADGLADDADERGRCHVAADHADDGAATAVPVATARRMLCDAALQRVTHAGDGSIDLGRRSRVVRGRLKRALRERDGCCRFPGCNRRAWLDAHHQVHWTDGGATDLDNTMLLCGYHHRLVHEGGWRVEGHPNGSLRFIAADGTELSGSPPRFLGSAAAVHELGRSAQDGRCQWDGTSLDLHAVLDGTIHAPPAA
jgi:hypothetical protein